MNKNGAVAQRNIIGGMILVLATALVACDPPQIRQFEATPEHICPSCSDVNVVWEVEPHDRATQVITGSPETAPPIGNVTPSGSTSRRICATTTLTLTSRFGDDDPATASATVTALPPGGIDANLDLERTCDGRGAFTGWRGTEPATRWARELVVTRVTNSSGYDVWLSHNGFGQLLRNGATADWPHVTPVGLWEASYRGLGVFGCATTGSTRPTPGFREAPINLFLRMQVECP